MKQKIKLGHDQFIIRDAEIFGPGDVLNARLFARRVFALTEVNTLRIDPERAEAIVSFTAPTAEWQGFITRLTTAISTDAGALDDRDVPTWFQGEAVHFYRKGHSILRLMDSKIPAQITDTSPVRFGVANTAVSLSTVGEFLLPVATPVAAVILVGTNLGVIGKAATQLGERKVGVPLFHTALLTCSIVTGQVLAFALTDWSLRYWQRSWRKKLVAEASRLVNEALPVAETVCIVDQYDGIKRLPTGMIDNGDILRFVPGDAIPVDGRVVRGEGLVDETRVSGVLGPVRKSEGSIALAGSSVLVGEFDIKVERTGSETSGGRVAETLVAVAGELQTDRSLQDKAETLAGKTVMPTFATAGVGWLAGSLITVGAILHQDWISGAAMAVPLITVNQIRSALRKGAVVVNPSAIDRLSRSDFVVIDGDEPALMSPAIEVAAFETAVADADVDTLIRHIAGAALYLGDERAHALANVCRERGLVVRQPVLKTLARGRVEVQLGEHSIVLIDDEASASGVPARLVVVIDGREAASIGFGQSVTIGAAAAIARIRNSGRQVFLVSSAPEARVSEQAELLGIALFSGELDHQGRIRFLEGLQARGMRPAYVGSLVGRSDLARSAYVSLQMPGFADNADADIVLLGHSYQNLAALIEQVGNYDREIQQATRAATLPNLLCVAGAFGGLLNGITSGIIANVGVLRVDRQLDKMLADADLAKANPGRLLLDKSSIEV
ncbi:MAG: cation-transporting ATPase [Methylococcaceae bacterium]|jgi:hypothetical protein